MTAQHVQDVAIRRVLHDAATALQTAEARVQELQRIVHIQRVAFAAVAIAIFLATGILAFS